VSAYCYNGECRTHQSQCRLWWGDNADKADDICYTEHNGWGVLGGNCGFDVTISSYVTCASRYVRHIYDTNHLYWAIHVRDRATYRPTLGLCVMVRAVSVSWHPRSV